MQIQKYKYTNTQIHKYTNTQIHKYTNTAYDEVPERPNMCHIFERFKDIKNDIPVCQTCKYKNANTKYTNTVYDKVPERPNMWHTFEMRTVQGYQK